MPAIVSVVAVFVRSMAPLVVFEPVKLPTVLAPLNVWPVAELVVNRPVVPSVPLEFSVMAPLAVASMAPEELATAAFRSRLPPVELSVTMPEPPAVTAAPMVSSPLESTVMLPLAAVVTAPVVVRRPCWSRSRCLRRSE